MRFTIPIPICSAAYGIRPISPDTIATMATPAAAPDAAIKPKPAPNANAPTHMAAHAIPNISIDADKANNVGIKGFNTSPATPIITNVPANVTKLLSISPQDMDPNINSAAANTTIAGAIISNANAPGMALFIRCIAPAKISNDPASTTRPFPISSQVMDPIIFNAPANITMDAATINKPAAIRGRVIVGNSLTAITIAASEPAKTVSPLPISPHDIVANIFNAPARITKEAANTIKDRACNFRPFGNRFTAATSIPIPTAVATRPFPISSQVIVAMIFIAAAYITNATHILVIALAALVTLF